MTTYNNQRLRINGVDPFAGGCADVCDNGADFDIRYSSSDSPPLDIWNPFFQLLKDTENQDLDIEFEDPLTGDSHQIKARWTHGSSNWDMINSPDISDAYAQGKSFEEIRDTVPAYGIGRKTAHFKKV